MVSLPQFCILGAPNFPCQLAKTEHHLNYDPTGITPAACRVRANPLLSGRVRELKMLAYLKFS